MNLQAQWEEDIKVHKDNPFAQDSIPIGTVNEWEGKKIEVISEISKGCEGCIFSAPGKECLNSGARCFGNSDGIFRKYILINEHEQKKEEETMSIKLEDGKKYVTECGELITVNLIRDLASEYPYEGSNRFSYTINGKLYFNGDHSPNDIVREYVEAVKQEPEGHIHAELMLEYAKDALVSREPWLGWEYSYNYDLEKVWYALDTHPNWEADVKHRRKPKTILINGYKVPEPLRVAPEEGTTVFLVNLDSEDLVIELSYDSSYVFWIDRGLLHTTRDGAIKHTLAFLSFTATVQEQLLCKKQKLA